MSQPPSPKSAASPTSKRRQGLPLPSPRGALVTTLTELFDTRMLVKTKSTSSLKQTGTTRALDGTPLPPLSASPASQSASSDSERSASSNGQEKIRRSRTRKLVNKLQAQGSSLSEKLLRASPRASWQVSPQLIAQRDNVTSKGEIYHRVPVCNIPAFPHLSVAAKGKRTWRVPSHPTLDRSTSSADIYTQLHQRYPELDRAFVQHYLQIFGQDGPATLAHIEDLIEARDGIVVPVDPLASLRGAVNSKGTSCYIDSLLFAMFARQTVFDGLLFPREDAPPRVLELQIACRLFVNQLRRGKLIQPVTVETLRTQLVACGWPQGEVATQGVPKEPLTCSANRTTQEDAGELFLFLTDTLGLPFLPFEVRLHHGADNVDDDERFVAERVLQLAIPEDSEFLLRHTKGAAAEPEGTQGLTGSSTSRVGPLGNVWDHVLPPDVDPSPACSTTPLHLKDLLVHHFYNTRITGIERPLKHKEIESTIFQTDAWSMLELFPFYGPQNELGDMVPASAAIFPEDTLVLPLMLKRYRMGPTGEITKIHRPIVIPHTIDFTAFVNPTGDAAPFHCDPPSSTSADSEPHSPLNPPPSHTEGALPSRMASYIRDSSVTLSTSDARPQYHLILKAAVCHLGLAPTSGHYVTYVAQDSLGNDHSPSRQPSPQVGPISPPVHPTKTGQDASSNGRKGSIIRSLEVLPVPPATLAITQSDTPEAATTLTNPTGTVTPSADSAAVTSEQTLSPLSTTTPSLNLGISTSQTTSNISAHSLPSTDTWLRFDDLSSDYSRVQSFSSLKNTTACFKDMADNAYLLFYQLYTTPASQTSQVDADRETALQLQHDYSTGTS
ncbi:hypothetical protein IWQ62_000218 [Dispira parvispora]|uniref:ubiquitinyl hydrolase 1 n=1 Tax=Dispira parvispora TaxID=1520584 RepID=A0A9W8AVA6_9FUNG|nr:hypothetical protein IWQ62_000218 [Dispira parvispora]